MALAVVQHQSGIHPHEVPGQITLGAIPTSGNLLVAVLGVRISPASDLVVNDPSWKQFNAIYRPGSPDVLYQVAIYRYVQPGDLALLPAFCTGGDTYWAHAIYEVSGVSGNWNDDLLGSYIMCQYDSNPSTPVTQPLSAYPAIASGSLAITAVAVFDSNENPAISGSWTLDETGNNASDYGAIACAHRDMNAGNVIDGAWSQTGWELSSLYQGGAILFILTSAPPTTPYPRNCWSIMAASAGHPTIYTLPWTPKTGALLLAYIDWFDGTSTNPTIDTGWTVFKTIDNIDHYIIGIYRYVAGGDTATLPNFTTSGSAEYCVTVLEIDGVTGTFSSDHAGDVAEFASPHAPSPWTTLAATSSANNEIGVIHFAQAGVRGQLYVYSNWPCANTITEFNFYGTISTFFKFFPTLGSTIQASIVPSTTPNTAAYIQTGIINVTSMTHSFSYAEIWG